MLQFINHHSHYKAGLYTGKIGPKTQLTCVIKRAWRFDSEGNLQIHSPVPAIIEADQFSGEINRSSLVAAREIMPHKEKSEIIVYGSAQRPPDFQTLSQVGLSIEWKSAIEIPHYKNNARTEGPSIKQDSFNQTTKKWHKSLFIFGERQWRTTLLGHLLSRPKPITAAIPLIYELAYGGYDPKHAENYYASNPAGLGFSTQRRVHHLPAPQIEISPLINNLTDRPIAAGYGPLPIAWQLAENESNTAIPVEINQVAPHDQRFDFLFGHGEIIKLKGMVAGIANSKTVTLKLSCQQPKLSLHLDEITQMVQPHCDTVVIDTEAMMLQQIWRAGIPWDSNDQRQGVVILEA